MSHFTALVILPPDTINIQEKVAELLYCYNSDIDVEAYKEYLNQAELQAEIQYLSTLSKEEIEKLAAENEVSGQNIIEELAKINLYWDEEDVVGVDEKGSYILTTYNPQGKWDYYKFIETEPRENKEPISYPCRISELPDVVPYALITLDGKWYESGLVLNSNKNTNEEEINWNLKVQEILNYYSNYLVVALNCHF